jgi:hypothetical protein
MDSRHEFGRFGSSGIDVRAQFQLQRSRVILRLIPDSPSGKAFYSADIRLEFDHESANPLLQLVAGIIERDLHYGQNRKDRVVAFNADSIPRGHFGDDTLFVEHRIQKIAS